GPLPALLITVFCQGYELSGLRRMARGLAISIPEKHWLHKKGFLRTGALVLALAMGVGAPRPVLAQEAATAVSTESSPQLFATLCALYASGFRAESAGPGADPWLLDLRARLVALQGPAAEALRSF